MYPFLYFRAVKTLNNYELSGSTLLAQITEKVIFLSILSRVAKKKLFRLALDMYIQSFVFQF